MITSPDNAKLKTIRKLHSKRERERTGLFVAEGEDLIEAATTAPELILRAGEPPVVLCFGSERGELPDGAEIEARIPMAAGGPESLNVAMAATVALYERFRMARHG